MGSGQSIPPFLLCGVDSGGLYVCVDGDSVELHIQDGSARRAVARFSVEAWRTFSRGVVLFNALRIAGEDMKAAACCDDEATPGEEGETDAAGRS